MNYLKERDGDLFSNADLKRLIVPLLIEQLLAIAVGMADSIMVSSVGEAAVSSVSLIDTIFISADQHVHRDCNRRSRRVRPVYRKEAATQSM